MKIVTRLCRRNRNLVFIYVVFSVIISFSLWAAVKRTITEDVSSRKTNRRNINAINQYLLQRNNFSVKAQISNWKKTKLKGDNVVKNAPQHPALVWWAPVSGMMDHGITCGDEACDVSVRRGLKNDPNVRAFLFYGTEFEFSHLPLPRLPRHLWALEHDESPKNNEFIFSHEEVMTLFNYTSTFKRESSYPVTTMALPSVTWLQSTEYFLTSARKNELQNRKGLAPVLFVHSDCNVPSARDEYLSMLQKFIKVDVYGRCHTNKELPTHLRGMEKYQKKDFFKFVAQYKFAFAFENAVCDDYMTEKLWRPFHLGVVPIVFGSPKVKEFLPSDKSALVVDDFPSVEKLAATIKNMDENDYIYDEYLNFKTDKNGITNKNLLQILNEREWSMNGEDRSKKFGNHFAGFECFMCRKVHENIRRESEGNPPLISVAGKDHYGCPRPKSFNEQGQYVENNKNYDSVYTQSHFSAIAFRHFYDTSNITFTNRDVNQLADTLKRHDQMRSQ
ncbi:alpha-(1,3)-fucosyltransferase 10-like [Mizuhopecten yessoensis]|uniref:Fucosyltransferase n=1 Tax=Mizuhopecten yessoensis TaxID=6573 RepID=A0A210PIB8_MIZYE|nr:alpha-(1,3)-fucosyltransferase 10-like [Mizuhopecten yessoensis]XP_021340927.1 alpha-(1,3)-fucosyltransferase 10-like [Mizuhopecten yessoensis]OWF36239.1 Alpha-(1,3)-fucosyltransferase 10 [Mizuhopecten yessoensis]